MSNRREAVSLDEKRKRTSRRQSDGSALSVGVGASRAGTAKRRSSNSALAKRLLVGLAIMAIVLVLAQPMGRWFMGPYLFVRMRTVPARSGVLEAGLAAKGILLREETVVLSPISGRLSLLAKADERIRRGTKVLSVEDRGMRDAVTPHVVKVEDDLKDLEMERIQRRDELDNQITQAQAAIDEARVGLTSSDAVAVSQARRKLRDGIDSLRLLSKARKDLDVVAKPERQVLAQRRDSIWSAMGRSEYVYKASISGLVSYTTDGLEGALSLHGRREDLARAVEDILVEHFDDKSEPVTVRDSGIAEAGAPVARVIDNFSVYIAALLPSNAAKRLVGSRVRIRFDSFPDESFLGTYGQVLPGGPDDEAIVLFSLDDYAPQFTNLRKDKVEIIDDECEGVIIPKSSIVTRDEGVKGVFLAKSSYPVFQRVDVQGGSGGLCVVSGVPEGARVVRNPWVVPSRFYKR